MLTGPRPGLATGLARWALAAWWAVVGWLGAAALAWAQAVGPAPVPDIGPQGWPWQASLQAVEAGGGGFDSGANSASAPQPVALPLAWRSGQDGLPSHWRLILHFELPAVPTVLWALRLDRLPPDHDMRLNGQPLSGRGLGEQDVRRFTVRPHWIELPPALLRPGVNVLTVEIDRRRSAGGIDVPVLGPAHLLRPALLRHQLWVVDVPRELNVVAAGLALFMVLLWALRPQEQVLGAFGSLWALLSLRNLAYYAEGQALPMPAWLSEWLFFLAQWAAVGLLLTLAAVLAHQVPPWRHPRWRVVLPCLLGAAGLLGAWQGMPTVRALAYPVFMALSAWALWRLWRAMGRASRHRRAGLLLAYAIVGLTLVHDYLFATGRLAVDAVYWTPYGTPAVMLATALLLLRRFVGALRQAESLGAVLEARVRQRTLDLEEAVAARSRFVAAASHDLRQPVAAITLLSGLLAEQWRAGKPANARLLERLQAAVSALESLLQGLLDLSRFEAGAVQARPQAVDLRALVERVARTLEADAQARGLQWRLRVPPAWVWADPLLLEQVLRNLLGNAVQYTVHGGVLLGARPLAGGWCLQVWDTGCGIPLAQQAAVFEAFVQLDNPARQRGRGIGLGLSLVQRAARLMGATVRLRSVPGRGSCFSLWLPPARPVPAPGPRAGAQEAPGADDGGGEGLAPVASHAPLPPVASGPAFAVWVLEDDGLLRDALCWQLRAWGLAPVGLDSLAALRQRLQACAADLSGPDLASPVLLTDHRLPDGDAARARAAFLARWPQGTGLVVTGDTGAADLQALSALGWPVLHKPFGPDTLRRALARAGGWNPPA
ncbi:sensor histidine kinase [Ideonella livida]|uniref:histidine kinase n=1 Tax=Ideonella livida TaxID=2707176 RepID=A0A7C9TLB0_9BURK|nr:HAMP domain-containing sensor histidine kinase [Ideonella livida]NDY90846.1 HAMP domain-containing histidine kinase [Ideonella livida]